MTPADLKAYRQSTGRNLRQFGESLGVTGAAVWQWENSKSAIPRVVLNLIYALQKLKEYQEPKLPLPIPAGKCACGCGGYVLPSPRTRASRGLKKGDYPAFKKGHNYRAHLRKEPTP